MSIIVGGRVCDAVPVDSIDELADPLVRLLRLTVDVDLGLSGIALYGGVAIRAASSAYLFLVVRTVAGTVGCKCLLLCVLLVVLLILAVLCECHSGVEAGATLVLSQKSSEVLRILFVVAEV